MCEWQSTGFYLPEAVRAPAHSSGQLRLPLRLQASKLLCRGPGLLCSDAAINTPQDPPAPYGLQAQHWTTRAQLGSLPTRPLAACLCMVLARREQRPPSHPNSKSVWCQVAHLHLIFRVGVCNGLFQKQLRQSVPQVLAPAWRWRLRGWSSVDDEVNRPAPFPQRPWHMLTAHSRTCAFAAHLWNTIFLLRTTG